MNFLARVTEYDQDRYKIHVPAFGVAVIVDRTADLNREARRIIARCGSAPGVFNVDLQGPGPLKTP